MKTRRLVMGLGVIMLILALVYPASAQHIKVALSDALPGVDYYQTTSRVNVQVAYLTFDPILERDSKTGELKPHLATSWEVIDDFTWEFKLRQDVTFQNGNPFNAESVRYTVMERILDPAQKSPQAGGFKWIKNVEVVDEFTFRIITKNPYPLVLQRMNVLFPYDPKWTREMEAKHGNEYLARHTMGTGPFKLTKFVEASRIELVKNPNYWKKNVPAYDKLTIRIIPEESTRIAELISGGIHDAPIGPDSIPLIEKNKKLRLINVPILRVVAWQFDSDGRAKGSPEALKDVRVRKAIWHAIDRKTLLAQLLPGGTSYLNIPINPVAFGAVKDMPAPEYNPEKAKALMKEAGWEKGFTVNIWCFNKWLIKLTEASMPYLDALNIKVKIRNYDGRYGEFAKAWAGGKCDGITGVSWGSYNIFDADALWSYFFMIPESLYNYSKDPELSDWLHAARETLDPDKRKELYGKAQQRIIDNAYWVPLWVQHAINGTSKKFVYEYGSDQVPRWQYGKWVN